MSKSILKRADNWKFWFTACVIGLAVCYVLLFKLFVKLSSDEARREATDQSSHATQVATCFNGVKNAPVVHGVLDNLYAIDDDKLKSLTVVLRLQPDSPLRAERLASQARLIDDRAKLDTLSATVEATTPTKQSCVDLAKEFEIPVDRYLQELRQGVEGPSGPSGQAGPSN